MDFSSRELLLALSYKYEGDWEKMRDVLSKKKDVLTKDDIKLAYQKLSSNFCDILSKNYPTTFKKMIKPPFVLYYYGNLELLNKKYRITCVGTREPTIYQIDICYKFIQEAEKQLNND